MHICKKLCIFVSIQLKTSPHSLFAPFLAKIPRTAHTTWGAGTVHEEAYEAFETNNWYNSVSTRDRSREGAEEAIDLSRRFQKPE